MYGSLDAAASGMVANRIRLEVATANLVNANTVAGPNGEYSPFRRRIALLASGDPVGGSESGVHVEKIIQSDGPFRKVYQPWHKFADADGYVNYPDIDPSVEQVNAMEAMRSYEANVMAAEATKSMMSLALRLLA